MIFRRHAVEPRTVAKDPCGIPLRARKANVRRDTRLLYYSHVLNGVGECSQNCVQVLENLTGSENFGVMTLLRWGEILSNQHLLRAAGMVSVLF